MALVVLRGIVSCDGGVRFVFTVHHSALAIARHEFEVNEQGVPSLHGNPSNHAPARQCGSGRKLVLHSKYPRPHNLKLHQTTFQCDQNLP